MHDLYVDSRGALVYNHVVNYLRSGGGRRRQHSHFMRVGCSVQGL